MPKTEEQNLDFTPFTIWMSSEYGKIPIRIDRIKLDEASEDSKLKLDIQYELLTDHQDFPSELLDLEEDEKNEFLTVIRVAVHNSFKELIEKEMNR